MSTAMTARAGTVTRTKRTNLTRALMASHAKANPIRTKKMVAIIPPL